MKNVINKLEMKIFKKMTFAVVAIAAIGVGSYKAYGSYTSNCLDENGLLSENILAISEGQTSGSAEMCWTITGESKDSELYYCPQGDTESCVKQRHSPSCSSNRYEGRLDAELKYCWK